MVNISAIMSFAKSAFGAMCRIKRTGDKVEFSIKCPNTQIMKTKLQELQKLINEYKEQHNKLNS